jgi:uncharacterized protein YjbI with pentapeptide repeats
MANQEHLELLRSGVEAINGYAAQHPDVTIDLSGADLSGMALRGLRIQGANLEGASLERADLQRALLNAVNLTHANLRGADCSGTSFHRANFAGADLRDVRFEAEFPPRLCIHESSFEGVRWSRERIEAFMGIINRNLDWEVRYEIVPRQK